MHLDSEAVMNLHPIDASLGRVKIRAEYRNLCLAAFGCQRRLILTRTHPITLITVNSWALLIDITELWLDFRCNFEAVAVFTSENRLHKSTGTLHAPIVACQKDESVCDADRFLSKTCPIHAANSFMSWFHGKRWIPPLGRYGNTRL